MLEIISQIVICLIIAGLIGGAIGYILGKNSSKVKGNQNNDLGIKLGETSFPKIIGIAPTTLLSEARENGKDNLQHIKGINSVMEKVLNEIGIYHYDQIADLSAKEENWLDKSIGFIGRVEREEWIEQAKNLT